MPGERKRWWMIIGGVVFVASLVLIITEPRNETRFVSARPPAARAKAARPAASPASAKRPAVKVAPAKTVAAAAAVPAEPAVASPAQPKGRNLFQPLVRSGSAEAKSAALGLAPWPANLEPLPALPGMDAPRPKQSRTGWSYVGTVMLNGVSYALIEENKTRVGVYLRTGDVFRGGRVQSIHPERMVIAVAGKKIVLPKTVGEENESKHNATGRAQQEAAAASAQPGNGQPGNTPAQPAAPGVVNAPAAAVNMQSPGGQDDAQRAWRRQRRLERMQREGGQ